MELASSANSVGFFRVAPGCYKVLEPFVSFRTRLWCTLATALYQCFLERFLYRGCCHCGTAHEEVPTLLQEVVTNELRLLCHLVRNEDLLRRIMWLVELEGSNQLGEDTLLLKHLPLIFVEKFLLLMATTIEDNHGSRGNAILLLVQFVLHEGADRSDTCSQSDHDHRGGVFLWELEGATNNGTGHLLIQGHLLDELGTGACLHVTCGFGFPLIDDNSELHSLWAISGIRGDRVDARLDEGQD
mmetsp:Transcript_10994/g.13703  ORF Transcript_10994/g.13703 Transcript_10994/m.13703 type:complete len:243 (-) Transcript_10994:98-826(-)